MFNSFAEKAKYIGMRTTKNPKNLFNLWISYPTLHLVEPGDYAPETVVQN